MTTKLFFFAVAAFGILAFSGCKKEFRDFTCECRTNFGISGADTTFTAEYIQVLKEDAQTICDSALAAYQADDPAATCTMEEKK